VLTELLEADSTLQRLATCVDLPEASWPADVLQRFSPSPSRGEPAAYHLRRWWNLFAEEVSLVHETRNRVVHQMTVSDAELQRAHWLARHLLEITSRAG